MNFFRDVVSAIPGAGLVEAAVTGRSVQPSDFIPGGRLTPGATAIDQASRGEKVTIGSFIPLAGGALDNVLNPDGALDQAAAIPSRVIDNTTNSLSQTAGNAFGTIGSGLGDGIGGVFAGAGRGAGQGIASAFQGVPSIPGLSVGLPASTLNPPIDYTPYMVAGGIAVLAVVVVLAQKGKPNKN